MFFFFILLCTRLKLSRHVCVRGALLNASMFCNAVEEWICTTIEVSIAAPVMEYVDAERETNSTTVKIF